MVYSLAHVPGADASLVVMFTLPQASLAVAVPNDGVNGHSMVAAAGTEVNTGAVLSSTVITCEAVAVPSAAEISEAEGLQPNEVVVPVAKIVGAVLSSTVIV